MSDESGSTMKNYWLDKKRCCVCKVRVHPWFKATYYDNGKWAGMCLDCYNRIGHQNINSIFKAVLAV